MEINQIISFAVASFLMALMPGPDNLFVITESLSKGLKNGLLLAFGLNSGVLFHTLAAATGLGILLKQSSLAFQIIQYAGAAYLLYLAYKAFREKPLEFNEESKEVQKESSWSIYKTGITMNVLNPKVTLFFVAFLPPFVDTKASLSSTYQLIILGFIFMLTGFITFASFALLAGKLRTIAKSKTFGIWTRRLKVTVLLVLGIYLLLPA